jgi:peptidoglycan/xylan/chitin deacetylase (PgdA/CDA1 family)
MAWEIRRVGRAGWMQLRATYDFARMVGRKIGKLFGLRWVSDAWPQGVISFTFDDFPKSAFTVGGSILERHGARGTYYVASKLAGTQGDLGQSFDADDIRDAHRNGHEIACHTYTHLRCSEADRSSLKAEIRANAIALSSIIEGFVPTNFAYPYGAVSPKARRVLKSYFASCRGIQPGVNEGRPNMAELFANCVYANDFDEAKIRDLIDRNRAVGGWLIFYTHDIHHTPSPYGCTPEQFEAVVAYAAESTTILPIRDVISRLNA